MSRQLRAVLRHYLWVAILGSLITLTGCTIHFVSPDEVTGTATATPGNTIPPSPTPNTTPTSNSDLLAGTSWQLTEMGATGSETPMAVDPTITLQFGENGEVGGNTGCNTFGGSYTASGEIVIFHELVSTLMLCTDPNIMEQEQHYLDALNSAERFAIDGDQLMIWYDSASDPLIFSVDTTATPVPTGVESTATTTPSPTETVTPPTNGNNDTGAYPPSEPTRISFGAGETSTEINGNIAQSETDYYVLQAQKGQVMSVEITSPNGDVLLTVVGEDGTPYKRYQNGPPSWTFTLPATQDYYIEAVSVGPATNYTLRVWIEPLGSSGGSERVEFAAGATSASRSGALPENGVKEYVLNASAGQTMEVRTVGYNSPVQFTIRGPDGGSWTGEAQGSEVYIYSTQVALPTDGDYIVTLMVPATYGATRYDVTFTIDSIGSQPSTPSPSQLERIEFAPGATSAERSGLLPSGPGTLQYVLTANAGQNMAVDATSDGTPLSMTIKDPTGSSMIPEMRQVRGGYAIGAQYTLPASGDYVVTLQKANHTPSTNYSVQFTIQ